MKILRVIHSLSNAVMDMECPDDFNLAMWIKQVKADGYINTGQFFVNWQWIQHAAVMTPEQIKLMQATPPEGAKPS